MNKKRVKKSLRPKRTKSKPIARFVLVRNGWGAYIEPLVGLSDEIAADGEQYFMTELAAYEKLVFHLKSECLHLATSLNFAEETLNDLKRERK